MNLLNEVLSQFSLKEFFQAFFCHISTASAKRIKPGARLTQKGEQMSFNERFEYLRDANKYN